MPTVPKAIENQTLVVSNLENPISFIIASSSSSGTWSPSTIILIFLEINTYDCLWIWALKAKITGTFDVQTNDTMPVLLVCNVSF